LSAASLEVEALPLVVVRSARQALARHPLDGLPSVPAHTPAPVELPLRPPAVDQGGSKSASFVLGCPEDGRAPCTEKSEPPLCTGQKRVQSGQRDGLAGRLALVGPRGVQTTRQRLGQPRLAESGAEAWLEMSREVHEDS